MIYTLLPVQGMVRVDFDMPMPHIESIYKDNFDGRNLWLDESNQWTRLECYPDEWVRYLERAQLGAAAAGDVTVRLFAGVELYLFREWMRRALDVPVMGQGGLQA